MILLERRRRAPTMSWIRWILAWWPCRQIAQLYFIVFHRPIWIGGRDLPVEGPIVFVANHQSHLDPPLVGILARRRGPAFLAKKDLWNVRPFGALIGFLGSIPVDLSRPGVGAFRAVIEQLEGGGTVLLFPEGHRSRDGRLGRFRRGTMLLVRKTGASVVPVGVDGTCDAFPRGTKLPRFGRRVIAKAGRPIPAEELVRGTDAEGLERVKREIETLRLEARAILRERTGGRSPEPGPADRPYWEDEAPGPTGDPRADATPAASANERGPAD